MTTKRKAASVRKAARAPTLGRLEADVASLRARDVTLKHDAAESHGATRKHDLARAAAVGKRIVSLKHQIASRKKAGKRRGLALDPDDVSCCAAQALAASLRLALGVAVADEDVLALYWRTAGDPDEGASVLATLEAASGFGLAGVRLAVAEEVGQRAEARRMAPQDHAHRGVLGSLADDLPVLPRSIGVGQDLLGCQAPQLDALPYLAPDALLVHGLILGLDLPEGPHAVLDDGRCQWWSWGEPYDPAAFPGAVIEEAWTVRWAA